MSPKIDIVTQKEAEGSVILIGIQIGFLGLILRLGIYKQ